MAKQDNKGRHAVPPLEWAAAGIGGLIAAGIIAILSIEAVNHADQPPPLLAVGAERLVANGASYVVEFEVSNRSARTAARVQVEGSLSVGGKSVETGAATIDYVPGNSRSRGALLFARDPRRHTLDLRVTGYALP